MWWTRKTLSIKQENHAGSWQMYVEMMMTDPDVAKFLPSSLVHVSATSRGQKGGKMKISRRIGRQQPISCQQIKKNQ
jgi:hypothetical protein